MIRTPVDVNHASEGAFGSASPAEIHRRNEARSLSVRRRIARYAVGAVKQIVAWWREIAAANNSGVLFSKRTVEAPAWRGKMTMPPRPKVNAIGGLTMKMSSTVGRTICRENVSAIAKISR